MPEKFPKPCTLSQVPTGLYQREIKYDGYRCLLARNRGECYVLSSHRGKKSGELAKFTIGRERTFAIPDSSVLDGELWWPNHHATDVRHALATDTSLLVFTPWAVLWWLGEDYRREKQKDNICRLHSYFPKSCISGDFLHCVSSNTLEIDPERDLRLARELGIEGWVYKDPERPWGEGWWKVKVSETVDCAVIGIVRGNTGVTGQFSNLVGSLILGLRTERGDWLEVGCTSGMTLQEREDFSRLFTTELSHCKTPGDRWCSTNPIMRGCVEVRFDEVASQGRLKMPRFIRTREDKQAEECSIEQLGDRDRKMGKKVLLPKEIQDAFGKVDTIRAERRQAAAQRGAETRSARGTCAGEETID